MTPFRLGLLGYGRIAGLVHAPVLTRMPHARLVAVAEPDPERRALAERHTGATGYAHYEALLEARAVDAVVICLPTPQHADAAVAAFEAGLHVYVEKPIATTAHDAARVLDAWRRAGTVGMAGFNFRFNPGYRELRDLVRHGALGRVVGIRGVFTSAPRALPPWKQQRATGGGVLLDLASHHLDLAPWLLGDTIGAVHASVTSGRTEDDTATVQATLSSGVPYQGFFSLAAPESHRVEVIGEEAVAAFDRMHDRRVRLTPVRDAHTPVRRVRRALEAVHPRTLLRGVPPEPSFTLALAAFVDAARHGTSASPTLDDGAAALHAVLAAERSARDGRVVSLAEAAIA